MTKMNGKNKRFIIFIAIAAISLVGITLILSSAAFFTEEKKDSTTEIVESTPKYMNETTEQTTEAWTTEVNYPFCPARCLTKKCVTIVGDTPLAPIENTWITEINATLEFRISVRVFFPDLVAFGRTNIIHFWVLKNRKHLTIKFSNPTKDSYKKLD